MDALSTDTTHRVSSRAVVSYGGRGVCAVLLVRLIRAVHVAVATPRARDTACIAALPHCPVASHGCCMHTYDMRGLKSEIKICPSNNVNIYQYRRGGVTGV